MNSVADLVAELARFNPDPALAKWVAGAPQAHSDQAQQDSAEVRRQITLREAELARRAALVTPEAPAPRQPRTRAGRQPLPDHLPRIEHRHEPDSCTCGQCGHDLVKIGEDVSEQLDVEPSRFFVHRHIRPQYACRSCETVTAAPVPPAVIDGGLAATGLYA